MKLEPNHPSAPSSSSSKESVQSSARDPNLMAELNLSPVKNGASSSSSSTAGGAGGGAVKKPFVPGHRKCRSDGANIFLSCSGGVASGASEDSLPQPWSNSGTLSNAGSEERFRHLLDDSLLEDPYQTLPVSTSSHCVVDDAGFDQLEKAKLTDPKALLMTPEELTVEPGTKCTFQVGCICFA